MSMDYDSEVQHVFVHRSLLSIYLPGTIHESKYGYIRGVPPKSEASFFFHV